MKEYMLDRSKIKGLMAEHGLTQKEMAFHIDASLSSFQNKMNGKTEFTVSELLTIAHVFGESPNIFFASELPKGGNDNRTNV